jgi:hypothetical protein
VEVLLDINFPFSAEIRIIQATTSISVHDLFFVSGNVPRTFFPIIVTIDIFAIVSIPLLLLVLAPQLVRGKAAKAAKDAESDGLLLTVDASQKFI